MIILKRARLDRWDKGEFLPYDDTPMTRRYRDEVQRINNWLEAADIDFDQAAGPKQFVASIREVTSIAPIAPSGTIVGSTGF